VEAEIALSDWADKMFEAQRVLPDTAQWLQQQKDARHMEATTGIITRFDVGSYVLISYNPQKMNAKPHTKLHPRLKGPYLVANVQGDKYSCQNLVTTDEMLVDLRHWPSMLNGGALMNLLTLGNRGRFCMKLK
jgi:ribosomal protein L21E